MIEMQIRIPGLQMYAINEDWVVRSFHKGKNPIRKYSIKKGYKVYGLMLYGKVKWFLAHRLVALTFIPNPCNHYAVNHKDGNKLNNHVSNLEWTDRKGNARHAVESGLYRNGGRHGRAKIVLNTQNGVFFDTVTDAADSVNNRWSRQNLNCMLTGTIKNISNFIYA